MLHLLRLHHLLRRHLTQRMHIRSSTCHALPTRTHDLPWLSRLPWHSHPTASLVFSTLHHTHRPIRARLHSHHRARLTNVWLSRT